MKFKHLIDNITIVFYSFENFANMKHIRRKYNLTAYYSKFISNKRIISGVRAFCKLCPKIKSWIPYARGAPLPRVFQFTIIHFVFFSTRYYLIKITSLIGIIALLPYCIEEIIATEWMAT